MYFDEIDQCPVCGSKDKKIIFKKLEHTCNVLKKTGIDLKNDEVDVDVCLCRQCGHKYLSKVIKDQYLSYYYKVVESEYYDSVKSNHADRRVTETKKFAEFIKEQSPGAKTVLEVGAGMGHLLLQLKNLGFETKGVEPSPFASKIANEELGLDVYEGFMDTSTFPGKVYDVIVVSDVVEHISGINTFFDLLTHYLAPGGQIFVLTGDSNSLYAKMCGRRWLYFFSWEHVSFFSKSSVRYLFQKHSLRLKYFKKIHHSGSYWNNVKIFVLTIRAILANKLGFRKHKFYYMAFDHFIAIAQKPS